MHIHQLTVQNYRNMEKGIIFPGEKTNIIYGNNAQGKTNLLEAMWLFTGERSFRGAKDNELVRFNAKEKKAKLTLSFFSGTRTQEASITVEEGKRNTVVNGVKRKGIGALMGVFCAVIFSPEHLQLIKGGPSGRRSFIDGALCQMKPLYAKNLYRYHHTLQQRNTLLKEIPKHAELIDTLEIWEERLARYGSGIIQERRQYAERITEQVQSLYAGISGGREHIAIKYNSNVAAEKDAQAEALYQKMMEKLLSARKMDISVGFTTIGPHRDDLDLLINEMSARAYGSQGQQRSAVLALKFAEAQVLSQTLQEFPVLFLDDVMSELDAQRQDYLLNHVTDYQVFITCCNPESVWKLQKGAVFQMKDGTITKEK